MNDTQALAHLSDALAAAVPFAIADLESKGGPGVAEEVLLHDWERMQQENADAILVLRYGTKAMGVKPGDAAKVFAMLTRVIAVMSFSPGGVQIFGSHFVGGEENRKKTAEVYGAA